jgi:hypothetical protein
MVGKEREVSGKNVLDIEKRPNEPIHFRTRIDVDELEGPPPRY